LNEINKKTNIVMKLNVLRLQVIDKRNNIKQYIHTNGEDEKQTILNPREDEGAPSRGMQLSSDCHKMRM